MVSEATTEILLEMYNAINLNEDSDIETTLVWTAVTNELENRNAIVFNDTTWEYEIVA